MELYKHASESLRNEILPYVVRVHGLDIPYRAQLLSEGVLLSESGSAVLRLDGRGWLIVEYFAHDISQWDFHPSLLSFHDRATSIRLVDTGVELPVHSVGTSRKTRRVYNYVDMPFVQGFECTVSGWIGDPSAEMTSAVATLEGCAILPLRSLGERSFRESEEENVGPSSTFYYDSRKSEIIELIAGGWEVDIHSLLEDERENLSDEPPYLVSIRRPSESRFVLSEGSEILAVLNSLLSFSSERWTQYSTIYCLDSATRPAEVNRAFVGRFASRGWSEKRQVTIDELRDWPVIFRAMWDSRRSAQMVSALTHIISCGERSKYGSFSHQDLVDASGALEAAVRLWNDLPPNHFFRGKGPSSLKSQLRGVISEFQIGGRVLDGDEVMRVVTQAFDYRHSLAHGSGGEFYRSEDGELRRLFAHQQYLYHLARVLVLTKLGGTSGHPGLPYYAPKLVAE